VGQPVCEQLRDEVGGKGEPTEAPPGCLSHRSSKGCIHVEANGDALGQLQVKAAYEKGALSPGGLAGGRTGSSLQYVMTNVRGDHIGCVQRACPLGSHLSQASKPLTR
jgi:hypothetical protein